MASSNNTISILIKAKDDASRVLNNLGDELDTTTQRTSTFGGAIGSSSKSALLMGAAAGATAAGVSALGTAIFSSGRAAITGATSFEQQRVAFETMLGSAEKAGTMLKDISDFAKKTPFQLPQVIEGAKNLAAYGLEAEKLLPTLKMLGDISSGVGTEKLPDLIRAFGQVQAKGKLMAQELNQFAEAGVPLREMLAKELKMSLEEFSVALDKGQLDIRFGQVESALRGLTEEGGRFFNLMDKQSATVGGKWSNLMDSLAATGRALVGIDEAGNIKEGSFFEFLGQGLDEVITFSDAVKDIVDPTNDFDNSLATAGGSANFLTLALRRQTRATQEFSQASAEYLATEAKMPEYLSATASARSQLTQAQADHNAAITQFGESSLFAYETSRQLEGAQNALNDALLREASASLQVIEARLDLRLAGDEVYKSTSSYNSLLIGLTNQTIPGLLVAFDSVTVQAQKTSEGIQMAVGTASTSLFNLNGTIGTIQNNVAGAKAFMGDTIKGLQSQADRLNGSINQLPAGSSGLKVTGRASTGPVQPGSTYVMNEGGQPEVFRPYVAGRVEMASKGSGVVIQNLNVNSDIDVRRVVREISWELATR